MNGAGPAAATAGTDVSALHVHDLMDREWLCANGVGGYASSSLVALNTRKYHGLLVAAMAPPVRRMVILSRVEDFVTAHGRTDAIACAEYPGVIHPCGHKRLRAFSAAPYPRWAYQGDGWTIEKSVRVLRGENTVVITYTVLTADQPIDLEVRPLLALRGMHELTYQWTGRLNAELIGGDEHQLRDRKSVV